MGINTLLKVLEQLLHKIKAKRRREMLFLQREVTGHSLTALVSAETEPKCKNHYLPDVELILHVCPVRG